MKCGGLYPALQIVTIAEAAGLGCLVGCLLETRLAITAGAHLVTARPSITVADLDCFTNVDDSGLVRGFDFAAPTIRLAEPHGTRGEAGGIGTGGPGLTGVGAHLPAGQPGQLGHLGQLGLLGRMIEGVDAGLPTSCVPDSGTLTGANVCETTGFRGFLVNVIR
jgi:hypothetical protein